MPIGPAMTALGRASCTVAPMDEPGPADAPLLPPMGRLSREAALDLLARADELLAAGEFAKAAAYYQRVVGFDDSAVTAAALLGLGEARYRMDDEDGAVADLEGGPRARRDPVDLPGLAEPRRRLRAGRRARAGHARLPRGRPAGARRRTRRRSRRASAGWPRRPATPARPRRYFARAPRRRPARPVLDDHHRRHRRSSR